MAGSRNVVLISEVGWKGMRMLSLSLLKEGLSVAVIIKGKVNWHVLSVITKPKGLKIRPVTKQLFKIYLFFYMLRHKLIGDIKEIVVSRKETGNWVKRFGFDVKLLIETREGYELSSL